MNYPTLDVAFEGIIDAYYTALKTATTTLEETPAPLQGVKTVVRGDRKRGKIQEPALWIFPQTSINNQSNSIREDWTLPVQIIAVTKHKDPILGYYSAFRLASKARSTILKDRKLGLEYVIDTISQEFKATEAPNTRNGLYAHYVLLKTKFNCIE